MIFQLFIEDDKVGGGGRYDALIPAMGGKDTPASGFALYLDTLMKMNLLEKLNLQSTPKISVKMDPETSHLGFDVAKSLREAGFIVKLHLGGKGPTDITWKLEVREKSPSFLLTDLFHDKNYELQSSEDILEKLRR